MAGIIRNYVKNKAKEGIKGVGDAFVGEAKSRTEEIIKIVEERLVKMALFLAFLMLGIASLVFSGYFFLIENLALSRAMGLFIMAVAALIIGFLISRPSRR